jgi:hypothetical protein
MEVNRAAWEYHLAFLGFLQQLANMCFCRMIGHQVQEACKVKVAAALHPIYQGQLLAPLSSKSIDISPQN